MKTETMMKWRVRRQSKCSANSEVNEDVRRSLEILDNVLAEFDDHDAFSSSDSILVNGDEQESRLSHAHQEKERWEDENGNSLQKSNFSSYQCAPNGRISPEFQSLDSSTDGSTSQNTSLLAETRRCSAPPIPKRSPGTRLSNRDRRFFPFREEEDNGTAQDNTSYHSLTNLQLPSQNGEHSQKAIAKGKRKPALSVPTPGSSSPVDDSAQISNRVRHGKITDEDPCLEFYLVRSCDDNDEADDDVFVSPPRRNVKCKTAVCQVCGGKLDHASATFVSAGSRNTLTMDSTKLSPHAEAHLRRMRLDKKFAKVKLFLQTNQVAGLDKPPPTFKPPAPPRGRISDKPPRQGEWNHAGGFVNTSHQELHKATKNKLLLVQQRPRGGSENETDSNRVASEQECTAKSRSRLPSKEVKCVKCDQENSDTISKHSGGEPTHSSAREDALVENFHSDKTLANQNVLPTDVLCKNCINKGWTFRTTEFVSSSPGPLNRPPLGLSYSMEDDLSPGIKEISGSSPKDSQNDSMSPKGSPVAPMSTFSHSVSSLGDGSSQSDLDFSNSLDSGKVPLTSIKSRTLPTDMKLGPSPFYSPMEGEHINGTDTKLSISETEAVRSSSAPPPPQDKGHWKKDKTGFSSKEKQDNNDADSSRQTEEEEVTTEAKPKKRSVWKSILRRK